MSKKSLHPESVREEEKKKKETGKDDNAATFLWTEIYTTQQTLGPWEWMQHSEQKTLLEHYRNYTAVMASIAGYSD